MLTDAFAIVLGILIFYAAIRFGVRDGIRDARPSARADDRG